MAPPPTSAAGISKRRRFLPACSSFLLACLLAFTLQIFFFSPISPDLLHIPPAATTSASTNNYLQRVVKVGEGILDRPEDVCVDKNGVIYTATRDGWIKRLHRNGSWENWKMLHTDTLLGITTIQEEGAVVVCDVKMGLLKVSEEGVTVLASHLNGSKIRLADEVIEASDGSLYFSVASTKYELHNWFLDVIEAKPYGQLLKYDPSSNQTSLILDNLCFANGVALSSDQDFLVVCETWKYRCLKYWLKGKSKGETEVFVENLPGAPDNIHLAPDGSFWIALLQLTSKGFEFVHTSKVSKHLLVAFPKLMELVQGLHKKATVINVGADGKIIRKFDDPNGKVMSFVTTAYEFEDHLYLGSLNTNFIEAVIEASDGSLYFSVASTKYELHNWFVDVIEAKPHGQLLKFDTSSNQTSLILDNLCFANGVVLSRDQDFLVVCETWKYRRQKYWLKGKKSKGETEVFIENLPGAPDNINLDPDGSFWIALLQLTSKGFEFVHTSKHLVAAFPKLMELVQGLHKKAMVINVGANGKIIRMFDDPNGKVMSFVTTAYEFEDHLYLESLNTNFIGKLPLKSV